jgi:hypothetical protein
MSFGQKFLFLASVEEALKKNVPVAVAAGFYRIAV